MYLYLSPTLIESVVDAVTHLCDFKIMFYLGYMRREGGGGGGELCYILPCLSAMAAVFLFSRSETCCGVSCCVLPYPHLSVSVWFILSL